MIVMKRLFLLLASALLAALGAISCADRTAAEPPLVITQVPLDYFNDSTAATYLADLQRGGVDIVLVSLEEVFQTGAAREARLEHLHDAIRYFEDAGFQTGVWTNSLGYGNLRPELEAQYPGLLHLTEFDGRTGGAICTTDTLFLGLMRRTVQDIARAGARFILMDDDLVQSVRPGFTCVCPGHLALLEAATGKAYTREQVRDLFTGAPSTERTAFLDVMGRSMTDFCRSLREAVDEVDPGIAMGICASYTHFDAEGVDMEELSRILAGEGHKPFMRLSGATYWPIVAPRFPGQTLGDVLDFVRMQAGWYRDRDIVLFDENDPYPRKSDIVPAAWCELYDKIMLAEGGVHRHKYMCCYVPQQPDRAYVEAHVADMEDDTALLALFRGTTPCGFRVWEAEHRLRDLHLPAPYAGNGRMMVEASHSAAAAFLGANGVPSCYTGAGGPGIAFGDQARLLPPEAFAGGLVLDVPAALALLARGVDVGLAKAQPLGTPSAESFDGGEPQPLSPMGTCYGLVPREGIDVRILGEYVTGGEHVPSCLLCRTPDGTFVIYGWDGYDQLFRQPRFWGSTDRMHQLRDVYRLLSGGKELPASLRDAGGLYALSALSADRKRLSLLLCNPGQEAVPAPCLEIPGKWSVSRTLRTEAAREDGSLVLSSLPAGGWCVVQLAIPASTRRRFSCP